ncbi:MAG: NAD(P)/FAD-dependent oxidoreductase [Sphingomonadales bacterium]|nr:NAD(P)/FAD-dependent oxidoreductase [Sphingomonadales bacterium]
MSQTSTLTVERTAAEQTHFDVLIVGAGISGIGAAYHLSQQMPGKSYTILETKDSFGGTWVTHTYPGVRSDSDLYTFGYRFKPWVGAPIATAEEILKYMGEVIEENHINDHIRYGHTITHCRWSSADNLWTVEAISKADGKTHFFTCNFLWMCQGYYNHDTPYTPDWPGMKDYKGRIVHPQTWPSDINLKGKKVVLIGSGATAATVVPAIADECGSLTLLQRSPTYFMPSANANELADRLREIGIDEPTIHRVVRQQINFDMETIIRRCRTEPEAVREELFAAAREYLGPDFDLSPHFTPSYRPWQQRVAFLPDGDLFRKIAEGKVAAVTDHIERFTENGILLKSGRELEADIVITATGFNLSVLGDIPFEIDDQPVDWSQTVTYRGMMFTGVPNMVWVFGYFRASWTLRVDLLADLVCRLLKRMDEKGAKRVEVQLRPEDRDMPLLPWIDADNFNPGYLQRGLHLMPKRGDKIEWQHNQDYWSDKDDLPKVDLDGSEFVYS